MTPSEKETLTRLLGRLAEARAERKDGEAEALIAEICRQQPDAAYLLVQRGLLLEQALQDAQARAASLQAEMDRLRPPVVDGWGNAPAPQARPTYAAPAASAASAGWGSGFLGNVASTAAGVVAGSFLFQGIEHLLGGHEHGTPANAFTLPLDGGNSLNDSFDGGALTALDDSVSADDWV